LSDKRVLLINGQNLLIDKQGLLIDKRVLVCILNSKSIIVYNLRIKYTPAYKIDSKVTLTYNLKLIERINYKARDLIKFKRGKEFNNSDLFLDLLFSLFY
jgi:hypothetical protein